MSDKNILFIGGGNIARAIIAGLIQNDYPSTNIYVLDRNQSKLNGLSQTFKINITDKFKECVDKMDIIILCIKPQSAKELCLDLGKFLQSRDPLIISVIAGITTSNLAKWLGKHLAIIRAMPNTPSIIKLGATALFANKQASAALCTLASSIMEAVGMIAWVDAEEDINSITALSGSGPAYYFYFIEVMQEVAIKMGLNPEVAKKFAIQTAYGAAKLASESHEDVNKLRSQVTSKGGTTYEAINVMQKRKLDVILEEAMKACQQRGIELSRQYGD